ncbi:MAG: T9SS type A sorting domain-containing protein [candidate division WOR-3 bacterium]|nr:T9SS type A sorting domain-containing protein [candidate division WOR-3 bacterium]MDH5683090.1 T9SS type A sorting domain-containing protein [candidate division WOR-3 bacterium]
MMKLRVYFLIPVLTLCVLNASGLARASANSCESNEFLIDTSIVYVAAMHDQKSPSIAFDGTNYFVVWQDGRNGLNYDIYGARMAQSGTVLDSAGIAISTSAYNQQTPAISFDGINYLVVWSDDRHGSFDIWGARINQSGIVIDPNGITISVTTHDQITPSISFDGTNYLVVWQDNRNGLNYDIYGARVSRDGEVLDPVGIAISTATDDQEYPAIAFDGSIYLVVWQDERNGYPNIDVYGTRVNQAGAVLDPNGMAITVAPLYQEFPAIAFDGSNYLVVWQDGRGNSYDIYGARVSQTGIVLDTTGIGISTSICGQYTPSVAFDETNYFVVWHDNRGFNYDIYGTRVNQTGIILDPNGIPIFDGTGEQKYSSVTFGRTNYLVAGQSEISSYLNNMDIYCSRVNQSGTVLDSNPIIISTEASNQLSSSTAFDGTNYLAVWQDGRGNGYDIYGARIDQNGTILDQTPIEISNPAFQQLNPCAAFGETSYFVIWQDGRNGSYDIYGTRVTQTGIILDPNGIPISTTTGDQCSPSIAFDGTNYLVVWQDYRSGYSGDIYGTRISQDGLVLEPDGIRIAWGIDEQMLPAVAFDGINYLVVWQVYGDTNTVLNIWGARISLSGSVLDPVGFIISNVPGNQKYPSLSFDSTNYLVVWEDYRNGSNADIYGARVTPSRVVLDPAGIAITTTINEQKLPSIAFDGSNYLVVWTGEDSGYYSIYGAKVSPSGTLVDSFLVSTQDGNQNSPALARGSGNQVLITYSGWIGEYQGKVYNTYHIWGKFYPFVGIEEERSMLNAEHLLSEIYPNPAKTVIRIRYPRSDKGSRRLQPAIKIFDVSGKLIREIASPPKADRNDKRIEISLKGINPGIYFLQIGTVESTLRRGDPTREVKKFLVVK